MEELIEQLKEVLWRDLVSGNEYLTLNILNLVRVIQVREIELFGESTLFGPGPVGFIHATTGQAFLFNDTPDRYDPENRFYEVPDQQLLEAIEEQCQQLGPQRFQQQMQEAIQELVNLVGDPEPTTEVLNIEDASYTDTLTLDLNSLFPTGDPITYEPFLKGESCVRLLKNNAFIFKQTSLQTYFNTGTAKNPLTNERVSLEELERFHYSN